MKKYIIGIGTSLFIVGCTAPEINSEKPVDKEKQEEVSIPEVSVPDLTEEKTPPLYTEEKNSQGQIYSDPARVQLVSPEEDQKKLQNFKIIE
jgi:hypothetical protein